MKKFQIIYFILCITGVIMIFLPNIIDIDFRTARWIQLFYFSIWVAVADYRAYKTLKYPKLMCFFSFIPTMIVTYMYLRN